MDIIIPLGTGSLHDNIELRFCLRSIEKFITGVDEVFMIGERPAWLKNVVHIPAIDRPGSNYKQQNIYTKILAACADPALSDNFLFFNDDHFILKPFFASMFPYHHKGKMSLECRQPHEPYYKTLKNTMNLHPGCLNFDTHCPIIYNKERFKALKMIWPQYGYCIKSVYCSTGNIEGEYYPDLKIQGKKTAKEIRELITGRPYFSIGNGVFAGQMVHVLNELFPYKSKYEV